MADDHSTSSEVLQAFLQSSQRIHIYIVGRLVKQQHITLLLQGKGKLQSVTLTTRECAAKLALISAREVESRDVGTHVDRPSSHAYRLISLRDDVIYCLLWVDILMLLIHIGNLDCLSHLKGSSVSLFQSHDESEKRGLTCTIRPNHTHNAVGWQHEIEVIEEYFVAECLLHMLCLDNLIAQSGTIRNEYLKFLLAFLLLHTQHLLVGIQAGFALGLACFG